MPFGPGSISLGSSSSGGKRQLSAKAQSTSGFMSPDFKKKCSIWDLDEEFDELLGKTRVFDKFAIEAFVIDHDRFVFFRGSQRLLDVVIKDEHQLICKFRSLR